MAEGFTSLTLDGIAQTGSMRQTLGYHQSQAWRRQIFLFKEVEVKSFTLHDFARGKDCGKFLRLVQPLTLLKP